MLEPPVAPGQVVAGKYRVERLLGEGGHGVVLAAEHLALGERVAIKLLRPDLAADEETVARFLREARASVRIKGEHVTRVLDVGSLPNGQPFMIMELLVGNDLATIVEARGWLPVSEAVDYVLQACEALAEAHGIGIVHRDIKPSNLFLTSRPDGTPCIKVLDFGISKSIGNPAAGAPDAGLTQTQAVLGSPRYMAPEQMRSSRRVDGRTDIWALGTTLHELITGRPPFDAKTMPELFAMILQDPAPRLSERRPEMPPALETVVARCLEKDPEKRFPSVAELARALAPFASASGVEAATRIDRVVAVATQSGRSLLPLDAGSAPSLDMSRTQPTAPPTWRAWAKVVAASAAIAFVLVGSGVLVVLARHRQPSPDASTAVMPAPSPSPAETQPAEPTTAAAEPEPSDAPTTDEPAEPEPSDAPPATVATAKKVAPPRAPATSRPARPEGAASTAASAPPPTSPPRAPGVASSRYD